jgi:hypothetical protein
MKECKEEGNSSRYKNQQQNSQRVWEQQQLNFCVMTKNDLTPMRNFSPCTASREWKKYITEKICIAGRGRRAPLFWKGTPIFALFCFSKMKALHAKP